MMLTLNFILQKDIETAIETLKQSVEVCNRFRRKNTIGESLGKMVKKVDYNSFTKGKCVGSLSLWRNTVLNQYVLCYYKMTDVS